MKKHRLLNIESKVALKSLDYLIADKNLNFIEGVKAEAKSFVSFKTGKENS